MYILFFFLSGANVIYINAIKPVFNKHESEIDAALNSIDPKSVLDAAVALGAAVTSGKKVRTYIYK